MACKLNKTLSLDTHDEAIHELLEELGFTVNYVETRKGRRFGSVTISSNENEIRLIDNIILQDYYQ